jgi:hypothetical protein
VAVGTSTIVWASMFGQQTTPLHILGTFICGTTTRNKFGSTVTLVHKGMVALLDC